jgi:NAD(P)-dependent dehydrogenase (short-subunit alcohol dehydrogenase family)
MGKRMAIITGSNRGIGKETAIALAKENCIMILACRNIRLAEEAKEYIRREREL